MLWVGKPLKEDQVPTPPSTRHCLGKDFEKGTLESEPSVSDSEMEAGNAEGF